MKTYLSVDLDYWYPVTNKSMEKIPKVVPFFKKILNLQVPLTVFVEHDQMLKDFKSNDPFDRLINMDYHSDICDYHWTLDNKPSDGTWVSYVPWRRKAEFIWLFTHNFCYTRNLGTCHGDRRCNPFRYKKVTDWKKVTKTKDVNCINFSDIKRVGVCLSPCYASYEQIKDVLPLLNVDQKEVKSLIDKYYRRTHIKRTKRVLSVI